MQEMTLIWPAFTLDTSLCDELLETAEHAVESGTMTEAEASRTLLEFVCIRVVEQ